MSYSHQSVKAVVWGKKIKSTESGIGDIKSHHLQIIFVTICFSEKNKQKKSADVLLQLCRLPARISKTLPELLFARDE